VNVTGTNTLTLWWHCAESFEYNDWRERSDLPEHLGQRRREWHRAQQHGLSGGLTVTGNGTLTWRRRFGRTIQNSSGDGISLTSTLNPSFTNMTIQNTSRSGINGSQVTGFTFKNGTINNSATSAVGGSDDANISFNDSTTNPNVSARSRLRTTH